MKPLAHTLRPTTLDGFIGQEHIVGPGKPLRNAIEARKLMSFILWGPPGVGKTTLARIYAQSLDAHYFEFSAVSAGKDDLRKVVTQTYGDGRPKVLFLDEIHRFTKAQQDFLLPYVESGELTLIGATTENPSFEVISALLSRCRVFVLNPLTDDQMKQIIARTGYALDEGAQDWLIAMAQGDARQAILMIEHTAALYGDITVDTLQNTLQNRHLRYDKKAEEHYNTISAFIKSLRASQPNAALYYLARMVHAGEAPEFIARRMVIFASEDIGLADPHALTLARDVFTAVQVIGYPECGINLAHGACYLAQAPKSRVSYMGYKQALADVEQYGNLPIPLSIRNASTSLLKELGYGKGYEKYTTEDLLPEALRGKKYI